MIHSGQLTVGNYQLTATKLLSDESRSRARRAETGRFSLSLQNSLIDAPSSSITTTTTSSSNDLVCSHSNTAGRCLLRRKSLIAVLHIQFVRAARVCVFVSPIYFYYYYLVLSVRCILRPISETERAFGAQQQEQHSGFPFNSARSVLP